MSFAAEPYGVFVDDLVSNLTGGITREEFRYPSENNSPQLGFQDDYLVNTVRVQGIVDGAFTRFEMDRDFSIDAKGIITWLSNDTGNANQSSRRPDRGSRYYVSYERKPQNRRAPVLSDRNPGSVLRIIAESFAREYAVISKQMEKVYRAGFLETAADRDLDQVVALVGITRRTKLYAGGEVVFSRTTPAPADINIPAGTLISTSDAPQVTVETTESRTLRSGSLSVAVPAQSRIEGTAGMALQETLTVIHRPILGVDRVSNPQDLSFLGGEETDAELRKRAARALEKSGAGTKSAIIGALMQIEGIREQDVKVHEDNVNHPGLIKITIAVDLTTAQANRAIELIESVRPAGIKVLHNLSVTPSASVQPLIDSGGEPGEVEPSSGASDGVWYPLAMRVQVVPQSATLSSEESKSLSDTVRTALVDAIEELGIGEPVIYNSLVSAAMAVDGVADVFIEVFPKGAKSGRSNIVVPDSTRATIDEADIGMAVAGSLVAIDLTVSIVLKGRLKEQDPEQAISVARDDIADRLGDWLGEGQSQITWELLSGQLPSNDDYAVQTLTYKTEYIEQGLILLKDSPELELESDQQPWLRTLIASLEEDGA